MYYTAYHQHTHPSPPVLAREPGPWASVQIEVGALNLSQGTHCTGKTGKMTHKNPCQGKHREFEILPKTGKTQGIWFAQVVNSLILKVKYISIFAAKIPNFFKLGKCLFSFVYVIVTNDVSWHRENLRLDRENTGILKV